MWSFGVFVFKVEPGLSVWCCGETPSSRCPESGVSESGGVEYYGYGGVSSGGGGGCWGGGGISGAGGVSSVGVTASSDGGVPSGSGVVPSVIPSVVEDGSAGTVMRPRLAELHPKRLREAMTKRWTKERRFINPP